MDKIVSLQTHDGASSVHSCMDILSYIVPYVYDIDVLDAHHLDRLSSLIKKNIQYEVDGSGGNSLLVNMSCCRLLCSLLCHLNTKDGKRFFKFSTNVLKILHEMFFAANGNIDHGGQVTIYVGEIVE